MVVHACNSSSQEGEAGGSGVQGHVYLQSKVETCLGYVGSYFKQGKTNTVLPLGSLTDQGQVSSPSQWGICSTPFPGPSKQPLGYGSFCACTSGSCLHHPWPRIACSTSPRRAHSHPAEKRTLLALRQNLSPPHLPELIRVFPCSLV